jgi:hypothetical protein
VKKLMRKVVLLLAGSRWREYENILKYAKNHGYKSVGIGEYHRIYLTSDDKVLVLRHDVDISPKAALKMARIDARNGCKATYYFRKNTAGKYTRKIKKLGFEIGFHYETVAEYCIENGIKEITSENEEQIRSICLKKLADDVSEFESRFGECLTIASHGHAINQRLSYPNSRLFEYKNSYRIVPVLIEAYNKELTESFDEYISDGDFFVGGFRYRSSVRQAIDRGCNKICFLSHPTHWRWCFW